MTSIVISQPMIFPWVGIFEQMRLADIFVHYDDVQLPQGRSFTTRVQVKTQQGVQWLTIPIARRLSGRMINEAIAMKEPDWRTRHMKILRNAYAKAPYADEMLRLTQQVYENSSDNLAEFNIQSIEALAASFEIMPRFYRSSELGIHGSASERLLAICQHFNADTYITGHGARNYLDHTLFEIAGVSVRYMDYCARPWRQRHGAFTPYVTSLDLIANANARDTLSHLVSPSVEWRTYLKTNPPE